MSEMVELPRDWPMFGYREWQTKNGRVLQLKDIDVTHLRNMIIMLARHAAVRALKANDSFDPEGSMATDSDHHSRMAQDYLRQVELYTEYLQWREENCYFFHAPKVKWDKPDERQERTGNTGHSHRRERGSKGSAARG